MKFSYKLQELRKGSGMSQEEFAELLGVSRQSVSKWESGKGYPEIDKLIFISNYFNTSLDLLLKDSQEDTNSTPISEKSVKGKRNSKRIINLTKPSDVKSQTIINDSSVNTFNNVPQYMSNPISNKKKHSFPIQIVNVPPYAQVRPVTNYQFGKQNNKLSKKGVLLIAGIGAFAISVITTVGIVASYNTSDTNYSESTVAEEMSYYDSNWETLYDDNLNSNIEQSMINDINNQSQSILIDKNGNVYYSGYDIINTYYNAQQSMRNSLDCSKLYQKYLSFEYTETNNYFLDVYSVDFAEWVIINENVIQIYPDQYSYDKDEYLNMLPSTMDFADILSSSVQDWQDYNTTPFEKVYRIHSESYASVSGGIVDLCIQAMDDRKVNLNMNDYMTSYEVLNNKCDLIKCFSRNSEVTFVPKEFLMVTVSDLDDSNNVISSENEEIVEDNENIVNNNISQEVELKQDDMAEVVE